MFTQDLPWKYRRSESLMRVVSGRKSFRQASPRDRFEKQVLGLENRVNDGRLNDEIFWILCLYFASSLYLLILCHTYYQSWSFHATRWTFNFNLACQFKGTAVTVPSNCDYTASLLLILKCIFNIDTALSIQVLVYLLKILFSTYLFMYFYIQGSLRKQFPCAILSVLTIAIRNLISRFCRKINTIPPSHPSSLFWRFLHVLDPEQYRFFACISSFVSSSCWMSP